MTDVCWLCGHLRREIHSEPGRLLMRCTAGCGDFVEEVVEP